MESNGEGQMAVDFAKRMEIMAAVNTYFKKREEHRMIYKSGEYYTLDYILWRRCNLKEKIARWIMYLGIIRC